MPGRTRGARTTPAWAATIQPQANSSTTPRLGTPAHHPWASALVKTARRTRAKTLHWRLYPPAAGPSRSPQPTRAWRPRRAGGTARAAQHGRTRAERAATKLAWSAVTQLTEAQAARASCGGAPATRAPCRDSEETTAPASTWCTTSAWKSWRRRQMSVGTRIRAARGAFRLGTPGRGTAPPSARRAPARPGTRVGRITGPAAE
jgi:hypothetical protein